MTEAGFNAILRTIVDQVLPDSPTAPAEILNAFVLGEMICVTTRCSSRYELRFAGELKLGILERNGITQLIRSGSVTHRGNSTAGYIAYNPMTCRLQALDGSMQVIYTTNPAFRTDEIVSYV